MFLSIQDVICIIKLFILWLKIIAQTLVTGFESFFNNQVIHKVMLFWFLLFQIILGNQILFSVELCEQNEKCSIFLQYDHFSTKMECALYHAVDGTI